MSISCVLGATDVCSRGSPAVRVSDAEQVRVSVVGDQRQHRPLTFVEMESKTAPVEFASGSFALALSPSEGGWAAVIAPHVGRVGRR